METLANPRLARRGQTVEFDYNDMLRRGTVERVGRTFITIRHDEPKFYSNKLYSTYNFIRLQSNIRVV